MTATAHKRGSAPQRRDTTVSLRLPGAVRDLIDTAAAASGTSRTEFVIESARRRAVDVMLDQRMFLLDDDDWKAFGRALDHPPPPNDKLKALMARKAPWKE
jgi:uncharacterized protein (DUF1778 family)